MELSDAAREDLNSKLRKNLLVDVSGQRSTPVTGTQFPVEPGITQFRNGSSAFVFHDTARNTRRERERERERERGSAKIPILNIGMMSSNLS